MKVLVISPQPFFSPRGTPISVYYRTLVTAELGAEVDLLNYGEGEDVVIPGVRIIRIPRFAALGSVKIGPSLLKLFLDFFIVLWAIALLLRNRYDLVHAHEEAVFFCRFLKPFFGFRLIYDMHSSLPQQLTNFGFTKSKFLISLFRKLEDSCLQAADGVITICPDLADYVSGLLRDQNRHFMIENSIFDPVRLSNAPSSPFDLDKALPVSLPRNKKIVVYAGTLEPYQGIDLLIPAFKIVKSCYPNAYLLIVGGTSQQVTRYSDMARQLGLEKDIFFTGRVPQSLAKYYCSLASVQVSPRSSGTNTPLKIYEQLANGIPLVATNIWSHTQTLTPDVAFLTDPTPEAMSRGIIAALDPYGDGKAMAARAQKFFARKYARPIYIEKMKGLFNAVLSCAA